MATAVEQKWPLLAAFFMRPFAGSSVWNTSCALVGNELPDTGVMSVIRVCSRPIASPAAGVTLPLLAAFFDRQFSATDGRNKSCGENGNKLQAMMFIRFCMGTDP